MDDFDLLESTFIKAGIKHGLSEEFLTEVFGHLIKNRFRPAGDRSDTRAQLERMIRVLVKEME